MTLIFNFSSVFLSATLAAAVFFASPTCSTSLEHPRNVGFRVELKHVDSGKNLTKFEQIQRGIMRGKQRLQKMNATVLGAKFTDISFSAPVTPGDGVGEFLMAFMMGTPGVPISGIADSGSDLIWTQRGKQFFDPDNSSSFSQVSCSSKLCESLPQTACGNGCRYFYEYGDRSYTKGILATETLTFGDVSVEKIGIGCGEDKEGDGFKPGSALVGLGWGPLSLVSQLKEQRFGYCVSYEGNNKKGTLFMGSAANLNLKPRETITTPMIKNPSRPTFYYLSLEGITIGGTKLSIKKYVEIRDGDGGLIIDSGTTVTFLEETVFELVEKLFIEQLQLEVEKSGSSGLPLCFILLENSDEVEVPQFILHFDRGDLKLPVENYMIVFKGLICLAMAPSKGMSIFGNFQQQNILVIHNLMQKTVSFFPTQCAKIQATRKT